MPQKVQHVLINCSSYSTCFFFFCLFCFLFQCGLAFYSTNRYVGFLKMGPLEASNESFHETLLHWFTCVEDKKTGSFFCIVPFLSSFVCLGKEEQFNKNDAGLNFSMRTFHMYQDEGKRPFGNFIFQAKHLESQNLDFIFTTEVTPPCVRNEPFPLVSKFVIECVGSIRTFHEPEVKNTSVHANRGLTFGPANARRCLFVVQSVAEA